MERAVEHVGAMNAFVQAAETRSFTEAGRRLGVSSSAIGKAMAKLEERLGVRLFHRSTRTITLTPEGALYLERCRRIMCEIEAAEMELAQTRGAPRGKLKISLPLAGMFFMPKIAEFHRLYPDVELDIDCSDRLVDVIEEGFDAVIRAGGPSDSRLMARTLGSFRQTIVGSPDYFRRMGIPEQPEDLSRHIRLMYRPPSSGKLYRWPFSRNGRALDLDLPVAMVANTLEPQLCFVEQGLGLACVPDFAIHRQLDDGSLIAVLSASIQDSVIMRVLWPSSRHLSPKLRVFVDFMAENLFPPAT